MLLEFSVTNDRAFAKEAVFSMMPSNLKDIDEGRILSVGDKGETKALSYAVIFGKNGSGKSTFMTAMNYLSTLVASSANESQEGEDLAYTPNRLVKRYDQKPTSYRILFSMKGTIYDYSVSHDSTRILEESLRIADQSSRFRNMFSRNYDKRKKDSIYTFGDALTGQKALWQKSTRDNALFLSTAVQLKSTDLRTPFTWLSRFLRGTMSTQSTSNRMFTAGACVDIDGRKESVRKFLRSLDLNVEDIEIEREEVDQSFLTSTFSPEFLTSMAGRLLPKSSNFHQVYIIKKTDDGKTYRMPLQNESTGTNVLFGLAGPLFDTLDKGYCLLVDEINANLHPLLIEKLVGLFNDPSINKNRAQLIFTTHDTSLMSSGKIRRDQIWFVENDGFGAHLVPLSDFAPRRGEALDRGYLGGRYGGVPRVEDVNAAVAEAGA